MEIDSYSISKHQAYRSFLQVGVLNGQLEEVQYALVLRAAADVRGHLVPVIPVQL